MTRRLLLVLPLLALSGGLQAKGEVVSAHDEVERRARRVLGRHDRGDVRAIVVHLAQGID